MYDPGLDRHRALDDLLSELIDSPIERVRLLAGSILLLNFGGRTEGINDSSPMLLIYMAAWRLEESGRPVAACEDDHERIVPAIARLRGGRIKSIMVRKPGLDLLVDVGDFQLVIFPRRSDADVDEETHWAAWLPSRRVVTAGPGTRWRDTPLALSPLTTEIRGLEKYLAADTDSG